MKLSTDNIPYKKQIKDIADTLNGNIYFVGGTVRDLILHRPINDIDIVVFNVSYCLFAEKIKTHLKATSINFKDNVRIIKNTTIIDVSKPRGHSIIEDLKLRDFTINSMSLDLDGNLINFAEDIKSKYITIQYDNAFLDDPLRMLRAYRLASELNFTIQKNTIEKILQNNKLIKKVAKERIYDELYKTFTAAYFNRNYKLFIESQLYNILLDLTYDITSKKFTAKCLNNYFNNCVSFPNNRFLHIIIFLTIYHFITNKNSKNLILEKLKKIIIVRKHLVYISKILYLLDMLLNIKINNNRLNHFIFENISFIPDILFFLTIIGKSNLDKFIDKSINCEKLYNKIYYIYNGFSIDRLNEITGNDLNPLDIPNGLIFGKLLRRAQYYLVSRKCVTKEEALQKIKKIWEVIHEIY
jgi:tRNA nucleotidyltransferase/poly(A) polymerase